LFTILKSTHMTVSFSQRGSKIQARITHGTDVSLRLSTGIKVPGYLKFHKGRFVGKDPLVDSLNNEIDRQKVKLTDLYMVYRGNTAKIKELYAPEYREEEPVNTDSYDLVDMLKRYVQMAVRGEIKAKGNRGYSEKTLMLYASALKRLATFSEIAGSLDLMEMAINPRDEASRKREITDKWNNYFRGFDDYMIDEGMFMSTRTVYLHNIAIMVNYWKDHLYLQLPKIISYKADPNPVVVLEPTFVKHFLTEEKTYNSLDDSMRYAWEISATILITTMRIKDAMNMSVNDLHITKDAMFLSKMNGKTREYTNVPIPKFLEKIYRENLTRYGRIFTQKNAYYSNLYRDIKTVFSLYPEMQQIATVKKFGVYGEETTEVAEMYKHIHPHMLRKTAITTMIFHKVSERHIKFCSGHSDRSMSFERYVAFVEKHFNSEVKNYYKDFLGE